MSTTTKTTKTATTTTKTANAVKANKTAEKVYNMPANDRVCTAIFSAYANAYKNGANFTYTRASDFIDIGLDKDDFTAYRHNLRTHYENLCAHPEKALETVSAVIKALTGCKARYESLNDVSASVRRRDNDTISYAKRAFTAFIKAFEFAVIYAIVGGTISDSETAEKYRKAIKAVKTNDAKISRQKTLIADYENAIRAHGENAYLKAKLTESSANLEIYRAKVPELAVTLNDAKTAYNAELANAENKVIADVITALNSHNYLKAGEISDIIKGVYIK